MGIIRVSRDKSAPWFMMSRETAQDENLSFKARGILTYLLSKPDGWEWQEEDIIRHGSEGKHAIRTGLQELKAAGYLTSVREADEVTGQFRWVKTVHERPIDRLSDDGAIDRLSIDRLSIDGKPAHPINRESTTRQRERIQIGGGEAEAAQPTPPPQPPPVTPPPEQSAAVEAYRATYPKARLTDQQQQAITSTVTDLGVWRAVLQTWQQNGYKPLIGNLIDRYQKEASHEAHQPKRSTPRNASPTSQAAGGYNPTPPPPGARIKKPWELEAIWAARRAERERKAAG